MHDYRGGTLSVGKGNNSGSTTMFTVFTADDWDCLRKNLHRLSGQNLFMAFDRDPDGSSIGLTV